MHAADFEEIKAEVQSHIDNTIPTYLDKSEYFHDQLPRKQSSKPKGVNNPDMRLINRLNDAYKDEIKKFNVILANPPYSIKSWNQKSFANFAIPQPPVGNPKNNKT